MTAVMAHRCPFCGSLVPSTVVLLVGGPTYHNRHGWYVALSPDENGVWAQLIVYAEEDTRESAVQRAQFLLTNCSDLAAYAHRYPIPTTSDGLTSRGKDIEIQRKPEGIA